MLKRKKQEKTCAFIDAEQRTLTRIYAAKLGVDGKEPFVSKPDNGEQAPEICDALVRSGAIDVIIVNSDAALTPKSWKLKAIWGFSYGSASAFNVSSFA